MASIIQKTNSESCFILCEQAAIKTGSEKANQTKLCFLAPNCFNQAQSC
jgi:hypothetical protein